MIKGNKLNIARVWHGVVPKEKADEYYQYLQDTGLKDYKETDGFCGIRLLHRTENSQTHFLLITFWDSFESIKKFSGEPIERARYYPEDEKYLLELEPFVKHYVVADEASQENEN